MKKTLQTLLIGLLVLSPLYALADKDDDLRKAAARGDLTKVERLIKAGADVNNAGNGGGTPIIKAAKHGHIDVAQALLFHGADPEKRNKKGMSAIDIAEKYVHPVITSILRTSLQKQSVAIDTGKTLSSDGFKNLASKVLVGRKWKIEHSESNRVIGRYDRNGRAYKVEVKMGGSLIAVKFMRGYGAKKSGYLENLKKDIAALL